MAEQPDAGDDEAVDGTDTAANEADRPSVDSDTADARAETTAGSPDSTTDESAEATPEESVEATSGESVGATPTESVEATPTESVDGTTTDGGTTQSGLPADEIDQPETPVVDDGMVGDGPDSDQEMPLADHIEEMMRRLGIVFLVAGIITILVYPLAGDLINFLWSAHIPDAASNRPRLYGPLEFILSKLKVAGLAGLLIGLPVFVYQTYRFMRPGLYPQERRYYLASVPTSLILGIAGVLFAHFLILPFIFAYFTTYTAEAAIVAYGLQETFNLILIMMGWMALIFQIPLFIMLAIMMGIVTRQWLEAKRLIFWGAFLGIAFIFSPDPTGMAPIMVTLTMVALFEGTLALLRWTGN